MFKKYINGKHIYGGMNMFFFIIFLIVFFVLVSSINVYIDKKENIYIVKLKINGITVINKKINNSDKKRRKNNINSWYDIKKIKGNLEEIWKIFLEVNKKFNMKKCKINVSISNNDYIKGSYYIAMLNVLQYMLKNLCKKINISYIYAKQRESLKFDFDINFKFRLYNNIINFIKVLIIIIRISKKGKMKNGTTSNRKFNGNCNVFN